MRYGQWRNRHRKELFFVAPTETQIILMSDKVSEVAPTSVILVLLVTF